MLHDSLSGLGVSLADLASEFWRPNVQFWSIVLPGRLFIYLVILNMQWEGECVFNRR